MRTPRSLAAAQTIPIRGDVEANLVEHVRLADTAAEQGARVLVFPELSLTGYELNLAEELAFTEDDPRLGPLVELAATRGLTLVVGAPARLGEDLHIGAFIVAPERSIELYTKHHLGAFPADVNPGGPVPPPEASVFEPGDRNPLVRFDGHTGAVAVCADASHPSHPEQAAARGARNYLASTYVIPGDSDQVAETFSIYAARHSMAVVFANFGGPTAGMPASGGSAIWSEEGELLVRLDERGSGLAIAHEEETGWRTKAVMLGA